MKYIKLALLPITFILLCYSITYASNTIKGDINGVDGITLEDTVLALQLSAGYSTQNQKVNANADINGDGVIGMAEVAYILRVLKQENVELIITPDDYSLLEGDSGNSTVEFTISLDQAVSQLVTVDYATSDDTATAGDDYEAASGELHFSPGETEKTVGVVVFGDTENEEGEETFSVKLSNPSDNAQIDNDTGLVTNIFL